MDLRNQKITVGELLDDPRSRAVFQRRFGHLLGSPLVKAGRSLTLEQLAEECHMNKFHLSHAFKKEYGISPINYMITRRIEESKYLLAETDLSRSQIAQLLGFPPSVIFLRLTQELEEVQNQRNQQLLTSKS